MNNFFEEMKQRKVFRTVTAYAVVAFVIMQLVEIVFPIFDIPNSMGRLVIIILFLGLPVVIILSWMFDITKGGVKKEENLLITQEPDLIDGLSLKIDQRFFYQKKRSWFALTGVIAGLAFGIILTRDFGLNNYLKSSEKSIAVVSFQNLSENEDKSRIGQILQELIITDLSDIPLLKVFSSQRLFDVQKQLGLKNIRSIDPSMALDVARNVGASSMLTGNIINKGLNKVLTSRLLRVDDGSVIKTHSVEGENIYALVDLLTRLVKSDLRISQEGPDLDIKEKTTESITAFKIYLEGIELLNDNHYQMAGERFKESLEIDSTFNDALYSLSIAEWWGNSVLNNEFRTGQDPGVHLRKILEGKKIITSEYGEKVEATLLLMDQKWAQALESFEKLVIKYPQEKDLWYNLGECYFHSDDLNIRALDAFEKTLELDHEYTLAYTHIFDIYYQEKMFERGINLAKIFIEQHPEKARGYKFMGQTLLARGNLAEAKTNFLLAKKYDTDDFRIDLDLVSLARLEENYAEALRIIESLLLNTTNIQNNKLLRVLTNIRMEQGQFSRAILSQELSINQIDPSRTAVINDLYLGMAFSALFMNNMESFENSMNKIQKNTLSTENYLKYKMQEGLASFRHNNLSELTAASAAVILKIDSTEYSGMWQYASDLLLGLIHIQKREFTQAELILSGRIRNSPVWEDLILIYLADLNLIQNNPEKTLEISQKMLSPLIDDSVYPIIHPRGYYMKGKALEKLGRNQEALKAYEHLLNIWHDADSTIPELIDLKNRVSRLTAQS